MKIVKVQLVDIARTWWAVEETKLMEPASWKQFTDSFYERFFPACAKKEMAEQFIKLQQGNKTIDEYASEFLRLSHFAPKFVTEEADRAERFQQGLRMDLQVQISILDLETYSQVLTKARNLERMFGKQERVQTQGTQKRPFQ